MSNVLIASSTLSTAVLVAAPLLMAAVGELVIERAGVLNLAIEGMMTVGAATTFVVDYTLGGSLKWAPVALLCAALAAMAVGLVLAVMCVTRRSNQVTVGIGLLIAATGAASLIYRAGVGTGTTSPKITTLPVVRIPILSSIPYLGDVLFKQTLFGYFALAIVVPVWWYLFRTPAGMRLRAVGENPKAVDSLGLSVSRYRYAAVLTGSGLIGIAGGFFPLVLTGDFSNSTINGRGWLAFMLVIFARWMPWRILLGGMLFAYLDSLQFSFAATGSPIPPQLLQTFPYIMAIIALAAVYGRSQAPAALGRPYDREARF